MSSDHQPRGQNLNQYVRESELVACGKTVFLRQRTHAVWLMTCQWMCKNDFLAFLVWNKKNSEKSKYSTNALLSLTKWKNFFLFSQVVYITIITAFNSKSWQLINLITKLYLCETSCPYGSQVQGKGHMLATLMASESIWPPRNICVKYEHNTMYRSKVTGKRSTLRRCLFRFPWKQCEWSFKIKKKIKFS